MTLTQVDALNRSDAQLIDAPAKLPLATRLREVWPVFLVGLGLVSTIAWTTLLGWLVYRAVLVLHIV